MKAVNLIVAVIVMTSVLSILVAPTEGQQRRQPERFKYCVLVLTDGKPVIMDQAQRITVTPPMGLGPRGRHGGGQKPEGYTFGIQQDRNDNVAVMNMLGADGWDVCASQSVGTGIMLYLRRPY